MSWCRAGVKLCPSATPQLRAGRGPAPGTYAGRKGSMHCREEKQTSLGDSVLSGCPQSGQSWHMVSSQSPYLVYLVPLRTCSGSVRLLTWKDPTPCFGEASQHTRALITWSVSTYRLQNHSSIFLKQGGFNYQDQETSADSQHGPAERKAAFCGHLSTWVSP